MTLAVSGSENLFVTPTHTAAASRCYRRSNRLSPDRYGSPPSRLELELEGVPTSIALKKTSYPPKDAQGGAD